MAAHKGVLIQFLAPPFLIQLPVVISENAMEDGQNFWAPVAIWELWKEFPAPGFGLAQAWFLWLFSGCTGRWKISPSLSLSSFLELLTFK